MTVLMLFRFFRGLKPYAQRIRCFDLPRQREGGIGPSYYIIPEIPPESCKETFNINTNNFSSINQITPDLAFNGFSRLLIDLQVSLSKLSENIQNHNVSLDSKLLYTIDEIFYPVEYALRIIQAACQLNNNPLWDFTLRCLIKKWKNYKFEYFCLDPVIYNALISLKSGKNLNGAESERLSNLVKECWGNGADFALRSSVKGASHGKDDLYHFRELRDDILHEERKFFKMVLYTSAVTGYTSKTLRRTGRYPSPTPSILLLGDAHIAVAESDIVSSAPRWLPVALGGVQNGGHVENMKINVAHNSLVTTLLRHCSNRQLRHTIWRGWVQRASNACFGPASGQHADNHKRIDSLRHVRHDLAKRLGCDDWLAYVWQFEHYRSPESPDWLIDTLLEPLRKMLFPMAEQELHRLTEWASANIGLPGGKLEPWDLDFVITQYNLEATGHKELDRIRPPDGMSFLSFILSRLNAMAMWMDLRLVPSCDPVDASNLRCRVEDVQSGQCFGEVIFDLFAKPGRPISLGETVPIPISMYSPLHSSSGAHHLRSNVGEHTTVLMVNSFPANVDAEGISMEEWQSIAHAFGTCLHYILPRAHHHGLFGLEPCLAPDMIRLPGDVFSYLATHMFPTTGDREIPTPKRQTTLTTNTIVALPALHRLYVARLDLALCSKSNRFRAWYPVNEECWSAHFPYQRAPNDVSPCSFVSMFGVNSQPGLQYQHVWRHVLLRDVAAGLVPEDLHATHPDKTLLTRELLKRFRDVIIAAEDLRPPAELFRRFRGRDPSVKLLFDSFNLHTKRNPSAVSEHLLRPVLAQ